MEPSVSRQGDLGVDLEVENPLNRYPSNVMYLGVLGPAPETAGSPHSIIVMQDGLTRYAQAHAIANMEIPNMEVETIANHVWEKWVKTFGFPKSIRSEMRAAFEKGLWWALCRLARVWRPFQPYPSLIPSRSFIIPSGK